MCRWVEGVGCSSRSLIPDPKKRKHKWCFGNFVRGGEGADDANRETFHCRWQIPIRAKWEETNPKTQQRQICTPPLLQFGNQISWREKRKVKPCNSTCCNT
jgi:hypothetical protein